MKKWIATLLLFCMLPAQSAFLSGWLYRKAITSENSKVTADLTDFTVYVNLADISSGDAFWGHVLSTGADIRMTTSDGTTQVPVELVKINTTTKVGELYFKAVGTLPNTSNATFYMYYGNGDATLPAASDTYGKNNAWDANYKLVSHFQNSSADSTVNGNTGSDTSVSYATAGMIGNGVTSDAVTDKVSYADNSSLDNTANQTVSAWLKIPSSNQLFVMSKHNHTGDQRAWNINTDLNVTTPGGWDSVVDSTGANTNRKLYRGGPSTMDNTLHLVHVTFSDNSMIIYEDGVNVVGSFSLLADPTVNAIVNSSAAVTLFATAGGLSGASGTIDEFRIARATRSSTWISTEYNNQSSSSTFYTLGAEETAPPPSGNGIGFGTLF